MAVALRRIYCIDTSSLAYCQRSFGDRPSKVTFYSSVWDLLDQLANDGRLIAPHLVYIEITKNRDHVGQWAVDHAGCSGQEASTRPGWSRSSRSLGNG